MGKLYGIALIVIGIWVGMEVYTEGTDRAFGGLFARLGLSSPAQTGDATAEPAASPLERIRGKVQDAADQQRRRIDRQID